MKMDDQPRADKREERRVDQRLLHAVAQLLHRAEMFDEPAEDVREGAARLARHHEVDVQGRKDTRVIP